MFKNRAELMTHFFLKIKSFKPIASWGRHFFLILTQLVQTYYEANIMSLGCKTVWNIFSGITVKLYANMIFLPFRLIGNQDGALLKAAFYRHWMIKSRFKCETRTLTF